MREKLIQYVNLLFAGADRDEVRDEILQNTLDRYDDLIAQGKAPEAAYRLAISGIGDIGEILGTPSQPTEAPAENEVENESDAKENRMKHAVSIAMYILCPIPLFILSEFGYDTIGLCMTLLLVAAATALRLTMKRISKSVPKEVEIHYTPQYKLRKSINSMIWAIGLALYFIISFATDAWMITWVIFPLIGAVQGLVKSILDLKEANEYEN